MTVLSSDEQMVVVHYDGPCDECGRPRTHTFRLPQRPGSPPREPHRFSYPEDGPSELLDPGEWVAVGQAYGGFADDVLAVMAAEAGEPDPAEQAALVGMLALTVSALDEAMKFLPPDAEVLPSSALWSDNGREVRRVSPEWFERGFLAEQRLKRWEQLTELGTDQGR